MTTINYVDADFRALFPAYSSTSAYPEATLQAYWNTAILYVYNVNGGCYVGGMTLAQQTQAINLMTVHLVFIAGLAATGQVPGVVTDATIDKVSVSLEPPPVKNLWQYWLMTSPYGQQLIALLQVIGCGGFYIGGAPELAAFRRVGGYVG